MRTALCLGVQLLSGCTTTQPDVLLITLDTVRADALGSYGATNNATPTLDRLAESGVQVQEVQSVAPLTLPSHASVMTGLYPDRHGLRINGMGPLGPDLHTLAEILQTQNWSTGAFVAAAVLDSAFGLEQGFDTYEDHFTDLSPERSVVVPQWDGAVVVDRALRWKESLNDEPAFAWVHLYDAHHPREVIEPFASRFPHDGYAAEIAEVDAHVDRLIREWKSTRGDPIIVVLSDHGESNDDHEEKTHGWFVYRSTMHVPWILSGPGIPAGKKPRGPASIVDVMPTVLEILGIALPENIDGIPIDLADENPTDRMVYGESWTPRMDYGFSELRVLQNATHRAILAPNPEVYRWTTDPDEHTDIADTSWGPWQETFKEWLAERPSASAGPLSTLDSHTNEALEALGYITGPSLIDTTTAGQTLPDPKDTPGLPQNWSEQMNRARSRPPAQGLDILDAFIATYPNVSAAHQLRVRALGMLGRVDEALQALAKIRSRAPQNTGLIKQEVELLLSDGKTDQARALIAGILKNTEDEGARTLLAATFLVENRLTDCVASANGGLDRYPASVQLKSVRGVCLLESGNHTDGEKDILEVLKFDQGAPGIRVDLALSLAKRGQLPEAANQVQEELKRRPYDRRAQATLGMIRAQQERWVEARELLAPLWADSSLGDDPLRAWIFTLESTGSDQSTIAKAMEVLQKRSIGPNGG